jgi:hypothetical protein
MQAMRIVHAESRAAAVAARGREGAFPLT